MNTANYRYFTGQPAAVFAVQLPVHQLAVSRCGAAKWGHHGNGSAEICAMCLSAGFSELSALPSHDQHGADILALQHVAVRFSVGYLLIAEYKVVPATSGRGP